MNYTLNLIRQEKLQLTSIVSDQGRELDQLRSEATRASAEVLSLTGRLTEAEKRAESDREHLSELLKTARLDAQSENALQELNDHLKSLKQQVCGVPRVELLTRTGNC